MAVYRTYLWELDGVCPHCVEHILQLVNNWDEGLHISLSKTNV
jgi:hypothetical protein